ncbi:hypothetical protein [Methanospirillum stamsii]|uniref:Uncharacterized protein n=1 Tax=Methanospirillum stamsii TaxID=1277351 RepID=A0A2V2N4M5_9EURY|nr:hypothetical protein [Methanospirillum stamsii]PWR70213.1 hypothetical protein DLD82_16210 [Methanospirillum stamsii]
MITIPGYLILFDRKGRSLFRTRKKPSKSRKDEVSPVAEFAAKLITRGEQSYIILARKKGTCTLFTRKALADRAMRYL